MKTGLVIVGGGVSGSTGIGVIEALTDLEIEISHIGGASSGSAVAGLYALTQKTDTLRKYLPHLTKSDLDTDWKSLLLRFLSKKTIANGWFRGEAVAEKMSTWTAGAQLSDWQIPCVISTTHLNTGRPVLLSQTPIPGYKTITDASIAKAIVASISIPGIFRPVNLEGLMLIDGGVSMNCPVLPLKALGADKVIVIDTISAFVEDDNLAFYSIPSIVYHTVNVMLRNQAEPQEQHADLILTPHVGAVGALSFDKMEHCAQVGYEYTMQRKNEILGLFDKLYE